MTTNSLPNQSSKQLCDPVHTTCARLLKTFLRVLAYTAHQELFFGINALYKLTFYLLLLTYFTEFSFSVTCSYHAFGVSDTVMVAVVLGYNNDSNQIFSQNY